VADQSAGCCGAPTTTERPTAASPDDNRAYPDGDRDDGVPVPA
jgi:hypothetical protein